MGRVYGDVEMSVEEAELLLGFERDIDASFVASTEAMLDIIANDDSHPLTQAVDGLLNALNPERLEGGPVMSDWQPIETAPDDGTTFVAFIPTRDGRGEDAFVFVRRDGDRLIRDDGWWIAASSAACWATDPRS